MVSNGPGFDIPTPSLTRWPYDEYHTSFDNKEFMSIDSVLDSVENLEKAFREKVWKENAYEKINKIKIKKDRL